MNKYTPDQLDQISKKISEIIDNPDYKMWVLELEELLNRKYLKDIESIKNNIDEIRHNYAVFNDRLDKIDKYLGIDFKLDDMESDGREQKDVNYSFIQDEVLREKANAYYREMLRYEYATRNHKQCFGEFCRLALIQVELMLNYFFATDSKKDLIRDQLDKLVNIRFNSTRDNWKNGKGPQPQKTDLEKQVYDNIEQSVHELNFSEKSKVFCNHYKFNKIFVRNNTLISISRWTNDMRNRKSHGSWTSVTPYEGKYEEDYLTEKDKRHLEELEKQLTEKIEDYNRLNDTNIELDGKRLILPKDLRFNELPEDIKNINNEIKQLQWISEKPFGDVSYFLRLVASTCAKELGDNAMVPTPQ